MEEVNDSAPGKDRVRMGYIKTACSRIIQTSVTWWAECLKPGLIAGTPRQKSAKSFHYSRKETKLTQKNYKGVCLLAMCSRILARIITKRLRVQSEKTILLEKTKVVSDLTGQQPTQHKSSSESKRIPVTL